MIKRSPKLSVKVPVRKGGERGSVGGHEHTRNRSDGSLAFELFGGLVEAMEELLDDDAELHRSVVQAVERRSLSLQAAEAAHRTVAPERKEERRRSLFSAETYSRVPPRVLPPLTAHKAEAEE